MTELQTFLAAAEDGSVSSAARRLHISPTAATKRIDNLEALIRATLFERGSRGVRLTMAGQRLLPRAQQFVSTAESILYGLSDESSRALEGVRRAWALRTATMLPSNDDLLADTERLLSAVLRASSDGVLITDHDDTVIDVNDTYCALTGNRRDDLLGRGATGGDAWHWSDEVERDEALARLERDGEAVGEIRLRTRDGGLLDAAFSWRIIELARMPCVLVCVRVRQQPDSRRGAVPGPSSSQPSTGP